jgi:cation transport regulator ChaC
LDVNMASADNRIAVFAYGSLVHADSAARTLAREVEAAPARLAGWRRRWSQVRDNLRSEKVFAIEPDGELPPWVLGLNLEPDPGAPAATGPNGALIEVNEPELATLDRRELRYDRVEVTDLVADAGFDAVFAYIAKAGNFAPQPPPGAVIVAAYARAVERGFAALGPGEPERFHETTGKPPVDPVEAFLIRDRIPQGNPREW